MVELLFPLTLREDMRDVFIHPRGLGLWGVYNTLKNFTFLNVVDVFIVLRFSHHVKGVWTVFTLP